MDIILPVKNCTGCSACYFRCPQDAISMVEDKEGFLYPQVDPQVCNSCGLCIQICPAQNVSDGQPTDLPSLYAGWTNDKNLLQQSTSGGVFSELARLVIGKGGVVFGAAYDNTMTVRHMVVETWDDLKSLQGSKYVQSTIGDTFSQAEKYLKTGRRVLYSGTSCQIAGLYAAIGKDYKHLLTCDLICHGVPSPKIFRNAVDALENQQGSKVVDFLFRDKSFGWLHPTVRITFADGTVLKENNFDNHFNLGFLKNIYLRPSCYQCPVKTDNPVADITLGDFWELKKYQPTLINRAGTSAVIVNTAHGHRIIQRCSERLALTECPFEFIHKDSNLQKSVRPSPEREAFFADMDCLSFEELTRKYIKPRNALLRRLALIRRICRRWIEEWK